MYVYADSLQTRRQVSRYHWECSASQLLALSVQGSCTCIIISNISNILKQKGSQFSPIFCDRNPPSLQDSAQNEPKTIMLE